MSTIRNLGIAILLSSAVSVSATESTDSGVIFSVGQNYFIFDDEYNLKDENEFYFGLGYQIDKRWSIELEYTNLEPQTELGATLKAPRTALNGIYRYADKGSDAWFTKVGYGKHDKNVDEKGLILGVGYDFVLNPSSSLVVGTDSHLTDGLDKINWIPYVGFKFTFGGQANEAAPAVATPAPTRPMDSDGDGVLDSQDQCPQTAKGVQVDGNGCEKDSDMDGVVDSKDQCAETPSGAKVDEKGCRIMLKENVSITLNVQFANNSDQIGDQYLEEIGKVATFMRNYPDTQVTIEGHTDSRGAANYNQQLSQKRASAVRQFLIERFNINPSRVEAIGLGEANPIADNETAEGRAMNRRVQAEIKTTVTKAQSK